MTYIVNHRSDVIDSPIQEILSYTYIDKQGDRLLISDSNGDIYIIFYTNTNTMELNKNISNIGNTIHIQHIGNVNYPTALCYIDSSFVYVGSTSADSQLIKILPEKNEDGDYIEIEECFTNLGPIGQCIAIDPENQGQSSIIACSGLGKWSSTKVINGGVGITIQAAIELKGISGLWSLKEKMEGTETSGSIRRNHKYLIESFVSETRVLGIEGQELSETELPNLISNEPTIHCGNVENDNYFIQIVSDKILLLSYDGDKYIYNIEGESNKICLGCNNGNQILVALTGGILIYLEVEGFTIKEVCKRTFSSDISCISIHPIKNQTSMEIEDEDNNDELNNLKSNYCAIGLWDDSTIMILELPSLKDVQNEKFENDTIPRSILLITLDNESYLFIGMGNGYMIHYQIEINSMRLINKTKVYYLLSFIFIINRFV